MEGRRQCPPAWESLRLEHTQACLSLSYHPQGDLAIRLVSPMGTHSALLATRGLPCPLHGPSSPQAHTNLIINSPIHSGMVSPDCHRMHPLADILAGMVLSYETFHFAGILDATHQMPSLCAFPFSFPETSS